MLLNEILPAIVGMHPDRVAIQQGARALTFAELHDQAARLAGSLRELGVRPGDRIGLLGAPCTELVVAMHAATALGAVHFAVAPELSLPEVHHIIADADPVALVYTADVAAAAAGAGAPALRLRIGAGGAPGDRTLEQLVAGGSPLGDWHKGAPDDMVVLLYTSGTTGRARGAMHTNRSVMATATTMRTLGGNDGFWGDLLLPNICHSSGTGLLWGSLYSGMRIVFAGKAPITARELVEITARERLPLILAMGAMLRELVALPDLSEFNLSCVRLVVHAGAPTSPSTWQRAVAAFPRSLIVDVYGSTESGPTFVFRMDDLVRAGETRRLLSVGKPIPQVVAARVVDEAGRDLPAGEVGEVLMQTPRLMAGYWGMPEATDQVIKDGWYHTGDLGKLDEEGFLYVVDRRKDMVIVGASNVYCGEVEAVLSQHSSIADVSVIGVPREGEGEEVMAVAVLAPGGALTVADLQAFCAGKLAAHKAPTQLTIVDALPYNFAGKVDKKALRQRFWGGRDRMVN